MLNKFRGDAALLEPGPQSLLALTGVPLAGVIPLIRQHGLPEEDGLHGHPCAPGSATGARAGLRVVVVCPPHISNLDEFQPLAQMPGVQLSWARTAAGLVGADWIVLPGSKQVSADLAWLRAQGLADEVMRHAAAGGAVLGICGGLQMLGESLVDTDGHDGEAGVDVRGLGLLPLATRYGPDKQVRRCTLHFAWVDGAWSAWRGLTTAGYEIHCGMTVEVPSASSGAGAHVALTDDRGHPLGWQRGSVLGVYAHVHRQSRMRSSCWATRSTPTWITGFSTACCSASTDARSPALLADPLSASRYAR